jgi:hypothetical protein
VDAHEERGLVAVVFEVMAVATLAFHRLIQLGAPNEVGAMEILGWVAGDELQVGPTYERHREDPHEPVVFLIRFHLLVLVVLLVFDRCETQSLPESVGQFDSLVTQRTADTTLASSGRHRARMGDDVPIGIDVGHGVAISNVGRDVSLMFSHYNDAEGVSRGLHGGQANTHDH